MATANPHSPVPARAPGRWRRRAAWLLVLVAGAALGLYWGTLRQKALTGAAFGARVACSCRYVAGRPLGDCRKDFEPGMHLVMLSEDREARSVTARVPLLASQTASWREGQGCALEPWRN